MTRFAVVSSIKYLLHFAKACSYQPLLWDTNCVARLIHLAYPFIEKMGRGRRVILLVCVRTDCWQTLRLALVTF